MNLFDLNSTHNLSNNSNLIMFEIDSIIAMSSTRKLKLFLYIYIMYSVNCKYFFSFNSSDKKPPYCFK